MPRINIVTNLLATDSLISFEGVFRQFILFLLRSMNVMNYMGDGPMVL